MSNAIEASDSQEALPAGRPGARRARLSGRGGDDLRPARPERRRQVDDRQDPDHADAARLRAGPRRRATMCSPRPERVRRRDRRRRAEARLRPRGDRPREPRAPGRDLRPAGPRARAARRRSCSSASTSPLPPDAPAKTYSGGMQRRLDIAMGLIHQPARCSSSTSRRPASTPRRAPTCGRRSRGSRARSG